MQYYGLVLKNDYPSSSDFGGVIAEDDNDPVTALADCLAHAPSQMRAVLDLDPVLATGRHIRAIAML
jgi:hypothetical protein